jgi:hypothetical protein
MIEFGPRLQRSIARVECGVNRQDILSGPGIPRRLDGVFVEWRILRIIDSADRLPRDLRM